MGVAVMAGLRQWASLPFLLLGTYSAWVYLRFFQQQPDSQHWGDASEDFRFSGFFPPMLGAWPTAITQPFTVTLAPLVSLSPARLRVAMRPAPAPRRHTPALAATATSFQPAALSPVSSDLRPRCPPAAPVIDGVAFACSAVTRLRHPPPETKAPFAKAAQYTLPADTPDASRRRCGCAAPDPPSCYLTPMGGRSRVQAPRPCACGQTALHANRSLHPRPARRHEEHMGRMNVVCISRSWPVVPLHPHHRRRERGAKALEERLGKQQRAAAEGDDLEAGAGAAAPAPASSATVVIPSSTAPVAAPPS